MHAKIVKNNSNHIDWPDALIRIFLMIFIGKTSFLSKTPLLTLSFYVTIRIE